MTDNPSLDISTLFFQAIQRHYRNAVVHHIRLRLTERFPNNWEDELKSPFKKEWDSLEANAKLSRETRQISTPLSDSFDVLDVNHFPNLVEKYFSVLFPQPSENSGKALRPDRETIRGWARNVVNARNPALGHPGDLDMDKRDALSVLDSAAKLLDFVDSSAAEEVRKIWDMVDARGTQDTQADPYQQRLIEVSTLPAREAIAPDFVGRQTELAALRSWFSDLYQPVYFLAGDGGKGKTSIAYEFATTVREDPPFSLEAIIWLSAKIRRFDSGSAVTIESPDFWDLPSALRVVLSAYGAINYQEDDIDSMSAVALDYMNQLPALIIMDDVDSLAEQSMDAMNFFVTRTAATKSKVLFTTRRIPFNFGANATQVQGFEPGTEDGLRFVDSRIALYGLDPGEFARSEKNSILQVCDGSPLYIQDLLRLCKVGETPVSAVMQWQQHQGEEARRYALGREFDMLSENAQRVLLTSALFEGPASLPELQLAANMPRDSVQRAIEELQSLFLVSRPRLTEETPRLDLDSNTRRLVLEIRGSTDLANRIERTVDAVLGKAQSTSNERKEIGQFMRQAVSQVKLDQHAEAEKTLKSALSIYPENPDLNGSLGWVYKQWNRYTDARHYFRRSSDLSSRNEEMYKHWTELEIDRQEWTDAAKAAERGLQALEDSTLLAYKAGFARSRLARELNGQGAWSRAEEEARSADNSFQKSLRSVEELESGDYRLHSTIYRAMALNYDLLIRIARNRSDVGVRNHFLRRLWSTLQDWSKEHPGDPNMETEKVRLESYHDFTQAIS